MNLTKSVVLLGMMGCGKTAIGERLAARLHVPFIDLDRYIEQQEKHSVSDIFASHGESYFRQKETESLQQLLESQGQGVIQVIALGGGAFIQEANRLLIHKYAVSIWIDASFEILLERVSRKKTRPLLEKGDKRTILKQLMDERVPIYQQADITVHTSTDAHEVTLNAMVSRLTEEGYIQ